MFRPCKEVSDEHSYCACLCPFMTQDDKKLLQNIQDFAEKFQQTNLRECAEQLLHRCIKYMHSLCLHKQTLGTHLNHTFYGLRPCTGTVPSYVYIQYLHIQNCDAALNVSIYCCTI